MYVLIPKHRFVAVHRQIWDFLQNLAALIGRDFRFLHTYDMDVVSFNFFDRRAFRGMCVSEKFPIFFVDQGVCVPLLSCGGGADSIVLPIPREVRD